MTRISQDSKAALSALLIIGLYGGIEIATKAVWPPNSLVPAAVVYYPGQCLYIVGVALIGGRSIFYKQKDKLVRWAFVGLYLGIIAYLVYNTVTVWTEIGLIGR